MSTQISNSSNGGSPAINPYDPIASTDPAYAAWKAANPYATPNISTFVPSAARNLFGVIGSPSGGDTTETPTPGPMYGPPAPNATQYNAGNDMGPQTQGFNSPNPALSSPSMTSGDWNTLDTMLGTGATPANPNQGVSPPIPDPSGMYQYGRSAGNPAVSVPGQTYNPATGGYDLGGLGGGEEE